MTTRIGVFALHCSEPTEWTQSQALLAEAVAREVGLALHTAELLEENRLRLGRQAALVQAAQVMTSELQVETVLQRLVVEDGLEHRSAEDVFEHVRAKDREVARAREARHVTRARRHGRLTTRKPWSRSDRLVRPRRAAGFAERNR